MPIKIYIINSKNLRLVRHNPLWASQVIKIPSANAGDLRDPPGWIPESGRSPGEGHGN